MIDTVSYTDVILREAIKKLGFKVEPHSGPYHELPIQSCGVTQKCLVIFLLASLKILLCMICHLRFGISSYDVYGYGLITHNMKPVLILIQFLKATPSKLLCY